MFNAEYCIESDENNIFEIAAVSVIGDRNDQQDSFGFLLKPNEGLMMVCDGMGGYGNGDLASKAAVECFESNYEKEYPAADIVSFLQNNTVQSNEIVSSLTDKNGEKIKTGSTLAALFIRDSELHWNSVGDSRIYLLRGEQFIQITQDHNYNAVLTEKLNAGLIDSSEYETENEKGEALISYLGIGGKPLIDFNHSPLPVIKNDRFIIMSDGLYKLLDDETIKRIMLNFVNIKEAVQALELKAQKISDSTGQKRDNMTVMIVNIK